MEHRYAKTVRFQSPEHAESAARSLARSNGPFGSLQTEVMRTLVKIAAPDVDTLTLAEAYLRGYQAGIQSEV